MPLEALPPAAQFGLRLENRDGAVAFDGTWNENQGVDDRDTNVRKCFELSAERDEHKLYMAGIGTRFGFLGRVIGGVFGAGRERVGAAYDHLKSTWKPGEAIDVVGFSRGSAVALDFVNEIAKEKGKAGAPQPPVRFLGLFDTVPAFGLPNVGPVEEIDLTIGHDLDLPSGGVQHCYHALALDECRRAFAIRASMARTRSGSAAVIRTSAAGTASPN